MNLRGASERGLSKLARSIAIAWAILTLFPGCGEVRTHTQPKLRQELTELSQPELSQPELSQPSQTIDAHKSVPATIEKFCGDCHSLPQPDSFVREVWYDEIRKGFEFYARSGRSDLQPPAAEEVVQFYRARAPAQIVFPEPPAIDEAWRLRFEREPVEWKSDLDSRITPAVSSIRWITLQPKAEQRLVVTDMRASSIHLVTPVPQKSATKLIGRVGTPARATPCDLDQDGTTDLVVSDLGSFNPYDHAFGRVVWLRGDAASDEFQPITIAENLGRVADVSVADFSGDERPDLVVAEFGHRETGGIRLLTNDSAGTSGNAAPADGEVRFSQKMLDIRPGAIQVPAHDWNGDGREDFAAVISQEFECVELFVSAGRKFDKHRATTGSDLTFGSVGIELADLDQDGDQDIVYVNGDCFDNNFANRSHGIQWLENTGNLSFRSHRLVGLPGAYRAVAGDIDGDRDLDILAVVNLPTTVYPVTLNERSPASIVLLEQVAPRQFETRVLERGTARYPALEVADFNSDGKLDFAVGAQLFETDPSDSPAAHLPPVAIWWQR